MKKAWLTALLAVTVASVGSSAALGEGEMRVFFGAETVVGEMPASKAESVGSIVNKLGGFTDYDQQSGKLQVVKPNVNIIVVEGVQQTRNKNVVFSNPIKGYSDKNVPRTFNVFVEVDEAPVAKDLRLQLVLIGPDGKVVSKGRELKYTTQNATSFFFSEPFVSTKLETYGTYKVQVQMKSEKFTNYVVVGENTFTVGR